MEFLVSFNPSCQLQDMVWIFGERTDEGDKGGELVQIIMAADLGSIGGNVIFVLRRQNHLKAGEEFLGRTELGIFGMRG